MLWKYVLNADVSSDIKIMRSNLDKFPQIFIDLVMLQLLLACFLLVLLYVCLLFLQCLTRILANYQLPELRRPLQDGVIPLLVAFFHPFCNAGGGGERVLWCAIRALQLRYEHVRCVIYTGDTDATREDIIKRAQDRFNIKLPRTDTLSLTFIYLYNRKLVEASTYPRLTLLGQSLGSVLLGFEAMLRFIPDIYVDSMGYAFTLPLFKYLAGSKVASYVHYPTISSDMLQRVSERQDAHNNASVISQSVVLSTIKLWYYKVFAFMYGCVGRFSNVTAVNSTWTQNHIINIWKVPAIIVYPPCNVEEFLTIPIKQSTIDPVKYIVSLSQFRPEKNHQLQLHSFKKFLMNDFAADTSKSTKENYKLLLIGSCRNDEDVSRVNQLKELVTNLELEGSVEFRLNVTFDELKKILSEASVGIHTMWNEHFGIGIVEFMAAGLITLANDSGGPKADIIVEFNGDKTGFLASDEESYAECLSEIFSMTDHRLQQIKENARLSVQRFSDSQFEKNFLNLMQPLFQ